MKKYIARILAVAMVLGLLCVQASAVSTENAKDQDLDVTITNVIRKETKTIKILQKTGYDETNYTPLYETVEKTVTIYYLSDTGSRITVNTTGTEGLPGVYVYVLEDGAYVMSDGGAVDWEWDEEKGAYWEPTWLYGITGSMGAKGEIYYTFDDGSAPAAPEETEQPTAPTTPEQPTAPTTPEQPTAPVAPAAPGSYTVKKGDTMGQIAVNYYGSYGRHKALYQANAEAFKATGGKLTPGMVLTLPEKLGNAVRISAPVAGAGESLYTVKAGDTLGAIAKATYGDVMQYKAIFERNNDRLKNANTIYEGQVIVLPAK